MQEHPRRLDAMHVYLRRRAPRLRTWHFAPVCRVPAIRIEIWGVLSAPSQVFHLSEFSVSTYGLGCYIRAPETGRDVVAKVCAHTAQVLRITAPRLCPHHRDKIGFARPSSRASWCPALRVLRRTNAPSAPSMCSHAALYTTVSPNISACVCAAISLVAQDLNNSHCGVAKILASRSLCSYEKPGLIERAWR